MVLVSIRTKFELSMCFVCPTIDINVCSAYLQNVLVLLSFFLNIVDPRTLPCYARAVLKTTGCSLPCQFNQFTLIDTPVDKTAINKTEMQLVIRFGSETISVAKEKDIYPLSSFIAEIGGCLGLFLGFSFLMVVDICHGILMKIKNTKSIN